jgi:hypothetical protein
MELAEAMAMGMEFAPGDGRGPEALYVLTGRVAELEAIRARAVEWFRDTDLTHPSVSEAAIHDAMAAVLGEEEN